MNPTITSPIINRRNLLLAAVATAAVLLLIVALTRVGGLGTKTLHVTQPFAANLNFAHQVDDHTIYYYSGTAFVSYDLTTHKTKPLTPLYVLPAQILQVVWSKQGVLINASGYSQADQLFTDLTNKLLDARLNYWWFVNFQTGTISLVGNPSSGADVRGAAWQGDGIVYDEKLDPNAKDLTVVRADSTGKTTQLGTLPDGAVVVNATASTVMYTLRRPDSHNDLMVMDLGTKKTTTAIKDVADVLAPDPNNNALVITQKKNTTAKAGEEAQGLLQLYSYATGKAKTVISDFSGTASWQPETDNWTAVGFTKNKLVGFDATKDKITRLSFTTTKDNPAPHFTAVGRTSDQVFLLNTSKQLQIAADTLPAGLPSLPDTSKLNNDLITPGYYVTYNPDKKEYSAYILKDPYMANVNTVLERIQGLGIDPYQINLRWYADAGINVPWRLPAGSEPLIDPQPIAPPSENQGD